MCIDVSVHTSLADQINCITYDKKAPDRFCVLFFVVFEWEDSNVGTYW